MATTFDKLEKKYGKEYVDGLKAKMARLKDENDKLKTNFSQTASLHHATTMGELFAALDSMEEFHDYAPPHIYRPIWKVTRAIRGNKYHPPVENNDPITLKSIMKIPTVGKKQAGYIKQWLEDEFGLDIPNN